MFNSLFIMNIKLGDSNTKKKDRVILIYLLIQCITILKYHNNLIIIVLLKQLIENIKEKTKFKM